MALSGVFTSGQQSASKVRDDFKVFRGAPKPLGFGDQRLSRFEPAYSYYPTLGLSHPYLFGTLRMKG
jgi:hypothetical protein